MSRSHTIICRDCGEKLQITSAVVGFGGGRLVNGFLADQRVVFFDILCPHCQDEFQRMEFGEFRTADEWADYLSMWLPEYRDGYERPQLPSPEADDHSNFGLY